MDGVLELEQGQKGGADLSFQDFLHHSEDESDKDEDDTDDEVGNDSG